MKNNLGGVWRTVGGRRIFIKDGEDLETAMKKSGKFGKKEEKREELSNRKNLVNYVKEQIEIDLDEAAAENQFAPRRGLNIDAKKLTINELNSVKTLMIKKDVRMESNGVDKYFIYFKK